MLSTISGARRFVTYRLTVGSSALLSQFASLIDQAVGPNSDQEALIEAAQQIAPMVSRSLPVLQAHLEAVAAGEAISLVQVENLPNAVNQTASLTALLAAMTGQVVEDGRPGCFITRIEDRGTLPGARTSDGSNKPFPDHTDTAYAMRPVDLILLRSIRNDDRDGGFSRFVDIEALVSALPADAVAILQRPEFLVPVPSNYSAPGARQRFGILRRTSRGFWRIRFRRDGLTAATQEGLEAIFTLMQTMDRLAEETSLKPGSAVIINNTCATHARTAFDSTGRTTNLRLLERAYIMAVDHDTTPAH